LRAAIIVHWERPVSQVHTYLARVIHVQPIHLRLILFRATGEATDLPFRRLAISGEASWEALFA
jgi:hypothetical protein